MIRLEGTEESSLSDGTANLSIRTAIKQFPLLKSIFRLLQKKFVKIPDNSCLKIPKRDRFRLPSSPLSPFRDPVAIYITENRKNIWRTTK